MAFTSVSVNNICMASEERRDEKPEIPETTQKKEGTTSAFSAASTGKHEDTDTARQRYLEDGEQGRASFYPGSTSQGGSNFGQGSSALGNLSYKQGSEKNRGSNYDNEAGRFAATGTQGQGYDTSEQNTGDDPRKQGGTDAEHDEFGGRRDKDDTVGIP